MAELVNDEKKLVQTKKGELNKILYSNNVSEDVFEMIHDSRRRAMGRVYTERTRNKYKQILAKLQSEKENLKIEKQILEAEINLLEDIMKD